VNEISRFTAEALLNSLPLGLAIAALAWGVTRVLARYGSAIRFSVWLGALSAILLIPWVGIVRATSSRAVPALSGGIVTLPEAVARYLVAIWAVGAILGLAHVVLGLYRLRCLRATCIPIELGRLDPLLRDSIEEVQLRRQLTVCSSESIRVPAAIGYFRPLVVFPSWALEEIPTAELNAILRHELAHLCRYDDWSNLAQKLVRALLFFHPGVWLIESRLTLEREMACDDAVLAANFSPHAYAESLVSLAEKSFLRRSVQLAQAAVGQVQQLKLRLVQILGRGRVAQRNTLPVAPAVAAMLLAGTITTVGIARAPQLVAFSGGSDTAVASASHGNMSSPDNELQPITLRLSPPETAIHATSRPRIHSVDKAALKLQVADASPAFNRRPAGEEAILPPLLTAQFPREFDETRILVIYQGEQFGPDGPILWHVTVWHLTPAQHQALTGGISKQI
jgi:beta-lactamase regulating signal transducer with metallopeptidase domain